MSCPAYYAFLGNLIEENDPQAQELVNLYIQLGRGTDPEDLLGEIRDNFAREDLPGEIRRRKAEVANLAPTPDASEKLVYMPAPGPDVGCMVCGGGYCEACWNDPGRPGLVLAPQR